MTTHPGFSMSPVIASGSPDGRDHDIRIPCVTGDVLRAGVCHRDNRIGPGGFLQEDVRHRLPHDVAPPHNDDVFPPRIIPAAHKHLLNTRRRAGPQASRPMTKPADIDGVKAIHILPGIDRLDHPLLVDVLREGKLDQDAVESRVGVPRPDQRRADPLPGWCRGAVP